MIAQNEEARATKLKRKFDELYARVARGPGILNPSVRGPAADEADVPEAFRSYARKLVHESYKITDGDVERLKAAGYSEDEIYELTLSLAVGEARRRLEAGLRVLGG